MKKDPTIFGVLIGLVVLSLVFFLIERVFGRGRKQPIIRKGWWTDVVYWVLTPLVQKQLDDRAAREGRDVDGLKHAFLTEKQPMAQFSKPEQIGALAVFLCSHAAATITGAPLSIDGGWVAQ